MAPALARRFFPTARTSLVEEKRMPGIPPNRPLSRASRGSNSRASSTQGYEKEKLVPEAMRREVGLMHPPFRGFQGEDRGGIPS